MSPATPYAVSHHLAFPTAHVDELRKLLYATDMEFLPPLSSRTSSTQASLSINSTQGTTIDPYLVALLPQRAIVATAPDTGELAAFMSYKPNSALGNHPAGPGHYVTTTIVSPDHRRRGLAALMYATMMNEAQEAHVPIIARTWSTNYPRLQLAQALGFTVDARVEDDRGPGVDTVLLSWHPTP